MRPMPRILSLLMAALVALLAAYPLFGELLSPESYDFYLQKITYVLILAIFAVSLDLLVGMTGLVSLGHAAFFGVAGYTLALMSPQYEPISLWIVLPAALLAAAAASLVIGVLVVRTTGIYFIMATLAFSQMIFFFVYANAFAGGSGGMYMFFKPTVMLGDWVLLDLENRATFYLFTLGCLAVVYLLLRMILRAPFGRVIVGIRENEPRVQALGYNTLVYKLVAFVIAGTVAGLAGFLAVAQYGFANPALLGWHQSAYALVMVILGGIGTLFGPVLGAIAFEYLHYVLESWTEHWQLAMGVIVIVAVLVLPRGLGGLLMQLADRRWRRGRRDDEEEEDA